MKKHIKAKEIDVVAAVLKDNKNFLIAKRSCNQSFPSKWEFPGGKVEKGESFQNALIREIKEELNVKINVLEKIASEKVEVKDVIISIHYYYAEIISGTVELMEHDDFKWIRKTRFKNFDFIKGDERILKFLS